MCTYRHPSGSVSLDNPEWYSWYPERHCSGSVPVFIGLQWISWKIATAPIRSWQGFRLHFWKLRLSAGRGSVSPFLALCCQGRKGGFHRDARCPLPLWQVSVPDVPAAGLGCHALAKPRIPLIVHTGLASPSMETPQAGGFALRAPSIPNPSSPSHAQGRGQCRTQTPELHSEGTPQCSQVILVLSAQLPRVSQATCILSSPLASRLQRRCCGS